MLTTRTALTLLLLIFVSVSSFAQNAAEGVETVTFRGLENCIRLANFQSSGMARILPVNCCRRVCSFVYYMGKGPDIR